MTHDATNGADSLDSAMALRYLGSLEPPEPGNPEQIMIALETAAAELSSADPGLYEKAVAMAREAMRLEFEWAEVQETLVGTVSDLLARGRRPHLRAVP